MCVRNCVKKKAVESNHLFLSVQFLLKHDVVKVFIVSGLIGDKLFCRSSVTTRKN